MNNINEELSYITTKEIKLINTDIKINHKLPKKLRRKRMSEINLHGVENLKKVGVAVASLVNAGMKSKTDDGKITWGDITHFIKIIPTIITAIPAIKYLKDELSDKLTTEEYTDFKNAILSSVEIGDEVDSEFVDQLFDIIFSIYKLVKNRLDKGKEKNGTGTTE